MSEVVQIVILSRDRVEYLREAIDSALAQKKSSIEIEIIVSDNSEKDDVNDLINKYYLQKQQIKYIRRSPPLFAKDHFEVVISELNTKYAVIFHDDDILHPNYVKVITPFLLNNDTVAVSCNAFLFRNKIEDGVKKMHKFGFAKRFNNEKDFLEQYLVGNGGIAPFPGYIYKTKFLKKISFDPLTAGKHMDAILLSSLLSYGSIMWAPNTLMYYRVHDSNDSAVENIHDRLKLLRYMFSKGVDRLSQPVLLYKYIFWLNWIQQQGSFFQNILGWRYRIVAKFIFFKTINFLFSPYFWRSLIYRNKG